MTRRLLIIWMLLIALPLQGFAAAAMLHCSSAHEVPAAQNGHHAAHNHAAMSGHAEHAAAADHHGGHAKADKCSACHSCCVASALPLDSRQDTPQPEGAQVLVPHPVKTFLSITLDSPQRPPRYSFA